MVFEAGVSIGTCQETKRENFPWIDGCRSTSVKTRLAPAPDATSLIAVTWRTTPSASVLSAVEP